MRNITFENITDTVIKSTENTSDRRLQEILTVLITKLHEFSKEVNLSHSEWEAAMGFLLRTGDISDEARNEFVLLSDLFGLSSLVDVISSHRAPEASERSVLGPFYRPGAAFLEIGGDLIKENEGQHVVFQGVVRNTSGEPLEGAMIDCWQNATNGFYENMDPTQPDMNLRCRMLTNSNGQYRFSTIKPTPYQVPDDGTGGEYMRATDRNCWRPAHLHVRVSAPGYEELVTEIFNEADAYIDSDATFGVRESLTISYDRPATGAEKEINAHLKEPFTMADFDFRLKSL
ncbi:MAG: dioxygenase [Sneathiella sp.]